MLRKPQRGNNEGQNYSSSLRKARQPGGPLIKKTTATVISNAQINISKYYYTSILAKYHMILSRPISFWRKKTKKQSIQYSLSFTTLVQLPCASYIKLVIFTKVTSFSSYCVGLFVVCTLRPLLKEFVKHNRYTMYILCVSFMCSPRAAILFVSNLHFYILMLVCLHP